MHNYCKLFICKNLCFVNDEGMEGCPKLGHTTLYRFPLFEFTYLKRNLNMKEEPNEDTLCGRKRPTEDTQGVYRVVCPNFGHPALTSSILVFALFRCCKHAMKIITIRKLKLFQNWQSIHNCCKTIFLPAKKYIL